MSFSSLEFIYFIVSVLLIYYTVPHKVKPLILLICNILFYYAVSGKYIVYFLCVYIILIYGLGLIIEKYRYRILLFVCIAITILPLIATKYLAPAINRTLLIPLGISFFSLQAVSYLIDIYKGKVCTERNIVRYAVYMSFFFYVMSGPIEKASSILPQLRTFERINFEKVIYGFLYFCWGMFQKIVLAERLAQIVDYVYADYSYFAGIELAATTILYSFQLFFDFAGYSNMAFGLATMFSIKITQNFKEPYLAMSIAEFWRRWHRSLSKWLKEYIYIPCGGNRKGKFRKYVHLFITFCISGVWHGIGLNYIVWGTLHAFYQIIGDLTCSVRKKIRHGVRIKENSFSYKLFKVLITFNLVNFAWIFFRTPSLYDAINIIKRIAIGFNVSDTFGISRGADYPWNISIGINLTNEIQKVFGIPNITYEKYYILVLCLAIAFLIEVLHYKKISVFLWVQKQDIFFRYLMFLVLVFLIILFGIYGDSYNSSNFIYANF